MDLHLYSLVKMKGNKLAMQKVQLQQTGKSDILVTKYERQVLSEDSESDITLLSTRLEETFSGDLTGSGVALHVRAVRTNKSDSFTYWFEE